MNIKQFSELVHTKEQEVLSENKVVERLKAACATLEGLQIFAMEFYPIRYSFVQLAFTVGARAPMHENYWYGLAKNLFEESGENDKLSHNELYRVFLDSIGLEANMQVPETKLSRSFNSTWFDFVKNAPIEDAIAAIGAYEIIDSPDYSALYSALRDSPESVDLTFFRVHSVAEHFSMFDSFFKSYIEQSGRSIDDFIPVAEFVLSHQEAMWIDLLATIEAQLENKNGLSTMQPKSKNHQLLQVG